MDLEQTGVETGGNHWRTRCVECRDAYLDVGLDHRACEERGKITRGDFEEERRGREMWRPQGDLNPCRRRERPVSWTRLDDGDAIISSFGLWRE